MTIYIAGPMTGIKDYNFPAFFKAEKHLKMLGYNVVNPARVSQIIADNLGMSIDKVPWKLYLNIDLILVGLCDSIYMLKGYENSVGAKKEFKEAKKKGLTIHCEV